MRLFRRRDNDAPATTTPDPDGPAIGASATAGDDGVARPPKQPTGDWMTMAPLAPSFASTMPTTFRVQTLPEILTSHHDTRLSGSLGHAVSSDGPSGSVRGLASHAGDVSHGESTGALELREPAHHTTPAAPVAPTLQLRRLADPSPISQTASAPTPPARLPEPTVSRSLLDTAPLAARPTWDRPLPVARVVDATATASAPAATSVESGPSSDAVSDGPAPLVGDDSRVGGFGVEVDAGPMPTYAADDDTPRAPAPPELAPPIQPRRLQRRVEGANATPPRPASPTAPPSGPSSAAAPLVGDAAPATSVDPIVPAAPTAQVNGGDLPLAGPAVSRLAEGATSPGAPSTPTSAPAPPPSAPSSDGPRAADLPLSRMADAAPSAPLAGSESLPTAAPEDRPALGEVTPVAGDGDLPLHAPSLQPPIQRLAEAESGATAAAATSAGSTTTPGADGDAAPEPRTTATLGADAEPLIHLQPMSESAGLPTPAPSTGTASLPLAATDLGGTLQAPTPTGPSSASPGVDASASTSSPQAAPLATGTDTASSSVQRLASGGGTASASPGSPPMSATSLPLVRPLATPSPAGTSAGSTMAMLAAPSTTPRSAGDLPVQLRRLGAPDVGAGIATVANLASTSSATPRSAAPGGLPLAAVQRLDTSSSDAPAGSTSTSASRPDPSAPVAADLPLHTPAASIPSAADVAVRAGLAERAPDGSLLYTSAPAAASSSPSISLQRDPDDRAEDSNGGDGGGDEGGADGADLSVQTLPSFGGLRAAAASRAMKASVTGVASIRAAAKASAPVKAGGGSDKDANAESKNLAAEAKKLYPFIRSALEADIRRQIEGKSRAGRFRP